MAGAHTPSVGHTAGPWAWYGNARTHEVYLATKHSGRRYVMGFRRWGMSGAQPMFQPGGRGLVPAEQLLTFEVGNRSIRGVEQAKADESVYRLDISGIDCADARLIAAAPDLLAALVKARASLATAVIAHSGGLFDRDSVTEHPVIAECDAAIARATSKEASHG